MKTEKRKYVVGGKANVWATGNHVAFDIECLRVPAPPPFPQKLRYQTYMIGFGYRKAGRLVIEQFANEDEAQLLWDTSKMLHGFDSALIKATRDFDVNVLHGVWTNARRAFLKQPTGRWPTLDVRAILPVQNLHWPGKRLGIGSLVDRGGDISGLQSMTEWESGGDRELVWRHNYLDVLDQSRQAAKILPTL